MVSALKVYEAELCEGNGNPGEVIALTKKELLVAAGEGALSLKVVQPAGKPKMSITDFLNGRWPSIESRRSLWKLNK